MTKLLDAEYNYFINCTAAQQLKMMSTPVHMRDM